MKNLLFVFLATLLLFFCSTNTTGPADDVLLGGEYIVIMVDDFALIDLKGDPLQINSITINEDTLTISVSYSGGCEQHNFDLFAAKAIMKSLPVQAQLILAHDANGDNCEAWITQTLDFNLSPLKEEYQKSYSQNGSMFLRIATASDSTTYKPWPLYTF
jgi:hypothetical protein